jgi:small subunit ribosomal protein S8
LVEGGKRSYGFYRSYWRYDYAHSKCAAEEKSDSFDPSVQAKKNILDVLVDEGYVSTYRELGEKVSEKMFEVSLKYNRSRPVINAIVRISKPSVHFYRNLKKNPRVASGLGNAILTTSRGVMSDVKARDAGVGGKILLTVW